MQESLDGEMVANGRPLRIAMVAPPWISIPAPTYGGIEEVVRLLCQGLVANGHQVTLFAAPGSESDARVVEVLDEPEPDQIEHSLIEAAHVGSVFDRIDRQRVDGAAFDVVHDHCPAVALAMADRLHEPLVHTLHGPFDDERSELYRRQGHKATLVTISDSQRSQAPDGVECRHVVPNPIDADEWPFQATKADELLFLGRIDPDKGPQRAIQAAQRAGRRLALAGPVQPNGEEFFATQVEPYLDGERVRYLGPVGGDDKRQALARARGLLMPIAWPEPFGLVMIEALVTGTPVIAFNRGAASEIVVDGENGFLVEDVEGMAAAIDRLDQIDPHTCRSSVERFSVSTVCAAYEQVYADAISPIKRPHVTQTHRHGRRGGGG
jgi:glycosyltransferase involved in cell wall biosynthesis